MATTNAQKPSWLANLLNKDEVNPTPEAISPVAPMVTTAPESTKPTISTSQNSDWANSVTVGKGTLHDDPMSGSIMKLLDENGFRQKIESGIQNGHTFNIIHNAPSTEFLMIEQWDEQGEIRKNYQAFTIKKSEPVASMTPQETLPPHPILVELRELDHDVDQLLALATRYA